MFLPLVKVWSKFFIYFLQTLFWVCDISLQLKNVLIQPWFHWNYSMKSKDASYVLQHAIVFDDFEYDVYLKGKVNSKGVL